MIQFIEGNALNLEIENIFKEASDLIMIVSPYIKLHHRFKIILKSQIANNGLVLLVLFGKNDGDITKSIDKEELDFFSGFPNVEIRYEPRLHAKYYANESRSIITSMNLYEYSQNNNIEAGMLLEAPPRISLGNNNDGDAFDYFVRVFENSDLLFKKEPEYDDGFLGTGFNRKYTKSVITENKLPKLIKGDKQILQKPVKEKLFKGHCIRCNGEIDFNTDHPLCDKCFSSWVKFQNKEYPEKFCHTCGKSSKTYFIKPVCYNCYRINKEIMSKQKV